MLIALIAFAATVLATILFAVVIVGMRQEPARAKLSSRAPSFLALAVRRLLGVYVGKPTDVPADEDREACLAGHAVGPDEDGERR